MLKIYFSIPPVTKQLSSLKSKTGSLSNSPYTDEPDPDAAYYERAAAAPAAPPPPTVPSEAAMRHMFALASQKLGGPEEPFKAWLAATHNYTGSRKDLSGAQVAWIIDELSKLPDHQEGETPNESR